MFPYADHPDAFWSGYFSSRANSKEFIRQGSRNLHAQSQLYAMEEARGDYSNSTAQDALQDAMGVTQHHDSAPGTEKQAVADDYDRMIASGIQANQASLSAAFARNVAEDQSYEDFQQCVRTNATYLHCPFADQEEFYVSFYNPSLNPQTFPGIKTKGVPASITCTEASKDGCDANNQVYFESICEPFREDNGTLVEDACTTYLNITVLSAFRQAARVFKVSGS
jgi:hypothetical protein